MATVVFPEIFNNGFTLLNGAITNVATTINVDSAVALGLDDSTTDAYVTIIDPSTFGLNPFVSPETLEVVLVTAVSTNALTVTRGVDGTTGTAFSDNAYVMTRNNIATLYRVYEALTDGTDTLNFDGVVGDLTVGTRLGVGAAAHATYLLHVANGLSGVASASVNGDDFVLEGSGTAVGLSILCDNSPASICYFYMGTPADSAATVMSYREATKTYSQGTATSGGITILVSANNVTAVTIDANQNVALTGDLSTVGEAAFGGAFGGAAQTGTGDGTTTIDWRLGNFYHFKFGAANETFTFTAPTSPGILTLRLIQDSVGTRSATWPATVKWSGASVPTLTATANTGTDLITLYYDGTNYIPISFTNDSR